MLWWHYLIIVIVIACLYVVSVYNNLVNLKTKLKNHWSQIDVQLKRRFDLIPNLVETVKGYAKHEKSTLTSVIDARNSYLSASSPEDQLKASGELTGLVNKLFALSESYPELKADKSFTKMQDDLKETEDKIAYARQFYNDAVMKYNAKIAMFPSNIVAKLFNFNEEAFFEAVAAEKENVNVKF